MNRREFRLLIQKCPECGTLVNIFATFCTTCGSRLKKPPNARKARCVFMLSPIFIILGTVAFFYEAQAVNSVDTGLQVGGALVLIYLFCAALFLPIQRLFGLQNEAYAMFKWALFGTAELVSSLICSFLLIERYTKNFYSAIDKTAHYEHILNVSFAVYACAFFIYALSVGFKKGKIRLLIKKYMPFVIVLSTLIAPACAYFSANASDRCLLKARLLAELSMPNAALKTIDEGLKSHQDNAELNFLRSNVLTEYLQIGYSLNDAIDGIKKAIKLKSGVSAWHYSLGLLYELNREYDRAVFELELALKTAPKELKLLQALAQCYFEQNQNEKSINAYKKALELESENPIIINNLAYTLLECDTEIETALKLARRSVKLAPNLVFNTDTLAWALYKNGLYTEALDTISKIISANADITAEIEFHYAAILYKNDMLIKPLEKFDKMLVKPEAAADKKLHAKIIEFRNMLEKSAITAEEQKN